MAGLLGMGGGAGASAVDFNADEEGVESFQEPAGEAEQAEYEMFVRNGLEVLYGTKEGEGPVRKEILGKLSANQDPQEALAQTAVWLTMMVETSASAAGKEVSDEVVMHGGKALFEELIEISEAAGLHTYREKDIQGAWYKALDMYREANTQSEENPQGRINPERMKAQFQELDDADRVGRSADILGMDISRATEQANALAMQDVESDTEEPASGRGLM